MVELYGALMVLVAIAILMTMISDIMVVSRKPMWDKPVEPRLSLVSTEDRRKQNLPFVGQDRRAASHSQVNKFEPLRRVS
jgi:hypothetical protein